MRAERSDRIAAAVAEVGLRVRRQRIESGLTVNEVSALVGIGAPVIAALERGDAATPLATVFAVAEALEIDPLVFFRDTGEGDVSPLDMPEVWEPPVAALDVLVETVAAAQAYPQSVAARAQPAPVPPAPPVAASVPAPVIAAPVAPVAAPVASVAPPVAPVPAASVAAPAPAASTAPAPVPGGRAPRTFADLRTGPLADRTFDTLPQFAVAAVLEGGHAVGAIARVFRVPAWKLQSWVDERLDGRRTG